VHKGHYFSPQSHGDTEFHGDFFNGSTRRTRRDGFIGLRGTEDTRARLNKPVQPPGVFKRIQKFSIEQGLKDVSVKKRQRYD
jgi:hypothetical protein